MLYSTVTAIVQYNINACVLMPVPVFSSVLPCVPVWLSACLSVMFVSLPVNQLD